MDPESIPQNVLEKYYDGDAIHTIYIGQVLKTL